MNMKEYLSVKNFTYLEYCDYLQNKYGIGLTNYMTKSYNKNNKITRTKDGLQAHHKKEDTASLLSDKKHAIKYPFEWQLKENIVYCDLLEHLLLHVLITKYPSPERKEDGVGYGGIYDFLSPELNDLYSGFETNQDWRKPIHAKVINDKDVYLKILEQFIGFEKENDESKDSDYTNKWLLKSYNAQYGLWDDKKNKKIYLAIKKLFK